MTTIERVLRVLEENRGIPQSGEAIAESLALSRTAVWKAVKNLREAGYEINAKPKKGYYLPQASDILSKEAVEAQLEQIWLNDMGESFGETMKPVSLHIQVEKEVTSTNRELSARAIHGAPSGSVLITGVQTSGKGHRDHRFSSPAGGLYMSVLLRAEDLMYEKIPQITAAGALAVREAVKKVTGRELSIHWVNDLYFQKKKVCGILTEGAVDLESGQLQWIVLGIGINYRTRPQDYPEEIRDKVGSLYGDSKVEKESGEFAGIQVPGEGTKEEIPPRARLAAEILAELFSQCRDEKDLMQEYRKCLDQKGEEITVTPIRKGEEIFAESYRALLQGVDDEMQLLILADGKQQTLSFGQVSIS